MKMEKLSNPEGILEFDMEKAIETAIQYPSRELHKIITSVGIRWLIGYPNECKDKIRVMRAYISAGNGEAIITGTALKVVEDYSIEWEAIVGRLVYVNRIDDIIVTEKIIKEIDLESYNQFKIPGDLPTATTIQGLMKSKESAFAEYVKKGERL